VAPVRFAETERRWLVPTLLVILVAVALGLAGLLIGRSALPLGDNDDDTPDATTGTTAEATGTALPINATVDYDPQGDGAESRGEAESKAAADGNPETAWSTERYSTREFGQLKDGVGLAFELGQVSQVSSLTITSPSVDWTAQVYVADATPDSFEGWGEPVTEIQGTDGQTPIEVEFEPRDAGAVLIWVTHLGEGAQVELSEVTISS
jgi:hypothetical protein